MVSAPNPLRSHDISKAASHFQLNQLPELYTAFPRDETTFPVQYIGANVPQAWAAGAAFILTLTRHATWLHPDVRIGHHKPAIRFWRQMERPNFNELKPAMGLWSLYPKRSSGTDHPAASTTSGMCACTTPYEFATGTSTPR
jgi:hypothetical protein